MNRSVLGVLLVLFLMLVGGCDSSEVIDEQQEIEDLIQAPTGIQVSGTLPTSIPRQYSGNATFTHLLGTTTITMILHSGSINVVLTLLGPVSTQRYEIGTELDAGKIAVQVTFVDSGGFDSVTLSGGRIWINQRTDTRVRGLFTGTGTSIYTGDEFRVEGKFDARCLAGAGDCAL